MDDCKDCAAKDATIAELIKALQRPPQTVTLFQPVQPASTYTAPNFYDTCGCNPKNGGSGICGCVRGSRNQIRG